MGTTVEILIVARDLVVATPIVLKIALLECIVTAPRPSKFDYMVVAVQTTAADVVVKNASTMAVCTTVVVEN